VQLAGGARELRFQDLKKVFFCKTEKPTFDFFRKFFIFIFENFEIFGELLRFARFLRQIQIDALILLRSSLFSSAAFVAARVFLVSLFSLLNASSSRFRFAVFRRAFLFFF
jgi:hypothetical protein